MKRKIHKQGSTAMAMRICADKMNLCHDNETGECFKFFQVTQEVLRRGLLCIAEEDKIPDKDGLVEATFLDIGDFIVITNKGLRKMSQKSFQEKFSF